MALPSPSSVCAVTAMVGLPRESSTSSAVRPVSRGTPEVYLVRDGGPGTEGAGRMHAEPVVEQRRRVLNRMERRVHHDQIGRASCRGRGCGEEAKMTREDKRRGE